MNTEDQIAELLAQAERLTKVAAAERTAQQAKAAYQEDPTDETLREAHRAASQALNDIRAESRALVIADTTPGSVTLVPPTVGGSSSSAAPDVEES